MMSGSGQEVEIEADERDAEAAEIGLALGADIEKPGMEGDREGKAGEDEVGRVEQRVADARASSRKRRAGWSALSTGDLADARSTMPVTTKAAARLRSGKQRVVRPARDLALGAHAAASVARPAIISADLAFGGVSAAHSPAMRPGAHDQHAIGKRLDLVELDRDQEHRLAAIAHARRGAGG